MYRKDPPLLPNPKEDVLPGSPDTPIAPRELPALPRIPLATRTRRPGPREQRLMSLLNRTRRQVGHLKEEAALLEAEQRAQKGQHKAELSLLKQSAVRQKRIRKTGRDSLHDLVALMRRDDISLPTPAVLRAYIEAASSPDDVRAILGSTKTLRRTSKKIRRNRAADRTARYARWSAAQKTTSAATAELLRHEPAMAVAYDTLLLKQPSEELYFFLVPLPESLAAFRVEVAHFDGKFKNSPAGFKQSVEFRLTLAYKKLRSTVTFAMGLLRGAATADYQRFFALLKRFNCKGFREIVTDFETAIHKAVRAVYPEVRVRGCWFHYWHNLLKQNTRLEKVCRSETRPRLLRCLGLLPFLHHPAAFLLALLKLSDLAASPNRYFNSNYRIIFFVFRTYLGRLGHAFFLDLRCTLARTNNVCEGKNSGQSKRKSGKATLEDFVGYVEETAKRTALVLPQPVSDFTDLELFLMAIQKASTRNVTDLTRVLFSRGDEQGLVVEKIAGPLPTFRKEEALEDPDFDARSRAHLARASSDIHAFVGQYRQQLGDMRTQLRVTLAQRWEQEERHRKALESTEQRIAEPRESPFVLGRPQQTASKPERNAKTKDVSSDIGQSAHAHSHTQVPEPTRPTNSSPHLRRTRSRSASRIN